MEHTRGDVLAAVRELFPAADSAAILAIVDAYGALPHERERERVQCAALRLSAGDEARLRELIGVARQDYRDILFWHDSPEEARIDTPERKALVRELFRKLGVPPPRGLDDA